MALKRLKSTGNDKESLQFRRQNEILSKLNHPNIVKFKDSFVWREMELGEDIYCLVMELLDGDSLKALLANNRNGIPWAESKTIILPILQALQYAAKNGVVHRDLKPSNIHLTSKGVPKLIDFGIARQDDGEATATSSAAGAKGTFDYMAPDFALMQGGFRGDEQSDIFSFGVLLYHTLAGKLPLPPLGENAIGQYYVRWLGKSQPSVEYKQEVFRVIAHARTCISKCIEPDRKLRFSTFDDVVSDFAKVGYRQLKHGEETYEFIKVLGKGGFGEVFHAVRLSDKRDVAVKRLFSNGQSSRFVREAKILRDAKHPNLTEYIDFVEVRLREDEREFYLVLEYLPGMPGASLRERIKASESGLDAAEALGIFASYLSCLEHLHSNGIIHRDIKPGNLYAPEHDPRKAKIFDLGIAHDEEGTKTHGQVPGTLDYMPPEFAMQSSGRGSAQSDLYSIGVTLFETLTRKLPFPRLPSKEAEAWVAFFQRAAAQVECTFDHPIFGSHPELIPLLRKALASDPAQRQVSAKAMGDEIQHILEVWVRRKAYDSAMEAGRAAVLRSDFKEAEIQARRAVGLAPKDEPARSLLSQAQEGAQALFKAALAAGRSALVRKEFESAKREAKRAAELNPHAKEAHSLLAQIEEALAVKKPLPEVAPSLDEGETLAGGTKVIGSEEETRTPFGAEGETRTRPAETPVTKLPVSRAEAPAAPPAKPQAKAPEAPEREAKEPAKAAKIPFGRIAILVATIAVVVGLYFGWSALAQRNYELAIKQKIAMEAEKTIAYNDAMAAGKTALDQNAYDVADKQAGIALGVRPGDPQSTALRGSAQAGLAKVNAQKKNDLDFSNALTAGSAALEKNEFEEADRQADLALGIKPGDDRAKALKGNAQAGIADVAAKKKSDLDYSNAMAAGNAALEANKFEEAGRQGGIALGIKPGDDQAKALQAKAETGLAEQAARQKRDAGYEVAMAAGKAALEHKDFDSANSQAATALSDRPGDDQAKALQAKAQEGLAAIAAQQKRDADYKSEMALAVSALEQKNFLAARSQATSALDNKPGDDQAKALQAKAQEGLAEIAAQQKREADYKNAMAAGEAAFERKAFEEAARQAQLALGLMPRDLQAIGLGERANEQIGEFKIALAKSQDALGSRRLAEANRQVEAALKIEPENAEASQLRDNVAQQRKRFLASMPAKVANVMGITGFDFVWVPDLQAGEGAYVEATELSQAQFFSLAGKFGLDSTDPTKHKLQSSGTGSDDPENLNFEEAAALRDDLNGKTDSSSLPQGKYQLPSQADFLIFSGVKGSTNDANPDINSLGDLFTRSGANVGLGPNPRARGVGAGTPNGFGLYNVLGNAWEWCDDQSGAGFSFDSKYATLFKPHRDVKGLYTGVRFVFVPQE